MTFVTLSLPKGDRPEASAFPLTVAFAGPILKHGMKPRAVLLFPPIYDFAAFDMYLKPFSLLRLGAWLESAGYEVSLINALDHRDRSSQAALGSPKRYPDGTGKFFRQVTEKPAALRGVPRNFARYGLLHTVIEERIRAARPDVILIASGMTYWYLGVREAVDCARAAAPHSPVVVGGVYATLCRDHALRTLDADAVIAGPAPPSLPKILGTYGLPVPVGPLPPRQLLIPAGFPDAAAVRLHSGCPLRCAYCASALVSGEFTSGRGEELFAEVKAIYDRFGVTNFGFYDDALLVNPEVGVIPFLEAVIDSGLTLRFHVPNGLHVALITERIARLMKRAGVLEFKLGYESSADDFHAAHDRKHDSVMFERAVAALCAGGYRPEEAAVYVLAGLPGQRPEEVEDSIHSAARLGVQVHVAEYSPIPGTALWEKSVAASSYPIAEEPLCQNNTVFPLQWEGFTVQHMYDLKRLAQRLTRKPRGAKSW